MFPNTFAFSLNLQTFKQILYLANISEICRLKHWVLTEVTNLQ